MKPIIIILSTLIFCYADNDTTIISNGSQLNYTLNNNRIDSASIRITYLQNKIFPDWSYARDSSLLRLSSPVDSGDAFTISYKKDYLKFPKKTFLYEKRYLASSDSIYNMKNLKFTELRNTELLLLSGYKSFSVSADNQGSVNLEQGLDIRIGGYIRPGMELSAHLNDQGSSLEGETREISEFDMIYIQLKDPSFNVIAGDQYVNWMNSGILSQQKKIKGISATIDKKNIDIKVFGSLSGGSYVVQNIECKDGIQGPYYLKGKGENGYINPISGTIKVRLNGKELKEGEDFKVDYDFGYITLKNDRIVNEKDIIIAEYEYKMFNYQQILAGFNTSIKSKDSSLRIQGSLWTDLDNKNNPIDITISDREKGVLQNSGDSLPLMLSETEVDPKDVSKQNSYYPLYQKLTDINGRDFYEYKPYDPNKPKETSGYFEVWFTEVGENNGEYDKDSIIYKNQLFYFYKYKGVARGRFSPIQKLPAPERKVSGELIGELEKKYIQFRTQFAGENKDKNTFSSKDDKDNNSLASKNSLYLGNKDKKGIYFLTNYSYVSKRFSREIISKYDRLKNWNDTSSTSGSNVKVYDITLGISPKSWLKTEMTYGQFLQDSLVKNEKFSNSTMIKLGVARLNYNGSYFRHFQSEDLLNSRNDEVIASLELKDHSMDYLIREEWNTSVSDHNYGQIENRLTYNYLPLHFNESFSFISFRQGQKLLLSKDTGYSVLWEQSINFKPVSIWSFRGKTIYNQKINRGESENITLLLDLENNIAYNNFNLLQQYTTNFEKASSYIQVPVYVGNGLGTYMYDPNLKQFVSRTPGDWFMEQKEVFDQSSDQRVRKTKFIINWSFQPSKQKKGILNDLFWEGNLFLEEHVDAEENKVSSWFPGYKTIDNYSNNKKDDEKVKYSDLSYRQAVNWLPKKNKELSLLLYFYPALKKIRGYHENSLETGYDFNRTGKILSLENITKYLQLKHEDKQNIDMKFNDLNSEFNQKILIFNPFYLSLKENIGFTDQKDTLSHNLNLFNNDSSFYYQLSTGIRWEPQKLGSAEIYYTFSDIPEKERMDYRIANGFQSGRSHVVTANVNIQASKYLQINCLYRGEVNKRGKFTENNFNQNLTMEAKVLF